jgi:F-type H+-transporting ATPase subunit gamma
MANLKEIRTRIGSVKSTRQITSAMKMVSAAKLKKAQDAILQLRPYAIKLKDILVHLSSGLDNSDGNIYSDSRQVERVLLVVITANRGLCGAFNANVVRKTLDLIHGPYNDFHRAGTLDVMLVGKKGGDILKSKDIVAVDNRNQLIDKPGFAEVAEVAGELMALYAGREYDQIDLVYNQFKNSASQILTHEQYLPVRIEEDEASHRRPDYIFEPSLEYMVDVLIPEALKIQFYKAILDSQAAEHGARMTAMHQATDNATELIRDLNLEYNKARQAAITNQLVEIVSGADALKS